MAHDHRWEFLDTFDHGFCIIRVLFDDAGRAVDYVFVAINAAFEQQTGLEDAVGMRMRELRPDHEAHWFEIYGHVARTGEPIRFERPARALGRWYSVYASRVGDADEALVAALFHDISDRRRAEEEQKRLEGRLAAELVAMAELHELSTKLVIAADLSGALQEILDATIGLQGDTTAAGAPASSQHASGGWGCKRESPCAHRSQVSGSGIPRCDRGRFATDRTA